MGKLDELGIALRVAGRLVAAGWLVWLAFYLWSPLGILALAVAAYWIGEAINAFGEPYGEP